MPQRPGGLTRKTAAIRRWARWATIVILVTVLGVVGGGLWAWYRVDRFPFDVDRARERLGTGRPLVGDDGATTVLLIGSDESWDKETVRADAVVLLVMPDHGGDPVLLSLPRDLEVLDPCSGGLMPLNAALAGCGGDASGPELLALVVEDESGLTVDHAVLFGFRGFRDLVDRVGGIELCAEHPVAVAPGRDILLDAGCHQADGATTLAWIRSRTMVELVGHRWRGVQPVGDQGRTLRQREAIFTLLAELQGQEWPRQLRSLAQAAGTVSVSDDLGLIDATRLARRLARLDRAQIRMPELSVHPKAGPDGYRAVADPPVASVVADALAYPAEGSATPKAP